MPNLLKKLIKALAYVAATVVILLAIAVGVFRLLLPRLPEYEDEIKAWANAAIGMDVEFADMNARWRLSGPELTFRDAMLTAHDTDTGLLTASEVSVSVSLLRLLRYRELVVDRIYIRGSEFAATHDKAQGWLIQGMPLNEIIGSREVTDDQATNIVVLVEDIAVDYGLPERAASVALLLRRMEVSSDDEMLTIDAEILLPDSLGERLTVSATQQNAGTRADNWQLFVEGRKLQLRGWSELDPERLPQVRSGALDLSASMQFRRRRVELATASFLVRELSGEEAGVQAPFGAEGRIEYSRDDSGWLLAASDFFLRTADGDWPSTALSVQVHHTARGQVQGVAATASYLNLDDLDYVSEWLPESLREQLAAYDPSGVLSDLRLAVDDLPADEPRVDVSAVLENAGIAPNNNWPGFRNVSGLVRSDNAGGRIELRASDLQLDAAALLTEAINFDDAIGTVIWRRNAQGMTILSDAIRLRNADLDSQSSLQITVPVGDESPHVDVQSNWSLNDIASVKRYLPARLIKPTLYQWLSDALVAGTAPRGSLQLVGRLDDFPFDDGSGMFRVDAHIENGVLRYGAQWPAVQNMTLDVVVDGMRLYTHENSAVNAGNSVKDAKVEIPDLRKPVLYIEAFATGTLESIRQFSRQSPIAKVFGGQLEQVTVGGDASFNLELEYPILNRLDYSFTTRIRTSNGSLAFAGFAPRLSELNGIVTVTRDSISSEALFGRFLGEQVNIDIRSAGEALPSYSVIAEAHGRLTPEGLRAELAPQAQQFLSGAAEYTANLRFPKAAAAEPGAFAIEFESSLEGMQVALPEPFGKAAASRTPLSFRIDFPQPNRIATAGTLGGDAGWTLGFVRARAGTWDFDRGVLTIGDVDPVAPETRGLHIAGNVDKVVLDDWLSLGRGVNEQVGFAERVRSIDVTIGTLDVIGQDLRDHRIQVDRSAEDWLIGVDGDKAQGTIRVPYDFSSGRPLVVDMQILVLPGREEQDRRADPAKPPANPLRIPPLSISADDFALGERHFGSLRAEFASTPRGLESTLLATEDETFTMQGSAGWVIEPTTPASQRTYLTAKLQSTDIRETLRRLDYQPGIDGEELEIDIDVAWPGGPGEDFLARVGGNVDIRLGSGQLDDVEPGAGRVFGLMSIVALPRRLSLDFRDVFEKGYGFDRITGTFRIEQGDAYTCDLSLEGPAADVGIVGRTGLENRDYDQTAVVSANVGNTLPVVGAVIAGPQVAAALLIFSQIFKKPLQEVGQIYYGIEGSWDDPRIQSVDADEFTATSSFAGCIPDGD